MTNQSVRFGASWSEWLWCDQLQLVAAQIIAGASGRWGGDCLLLLPHFAGLCWKDAATTVSPVICKVSDGGRKIYWERSKFPWHYIMRRRNNIARKPGLSFCPRNLRASKRKSISWDLHTVVLKLTHLYYHAGVAGELFPFCRWWKQGSVLSSVSQSVKTILFDPGFIPSRIRSTLWALFSACKLICLNPLPFPFSLCDFQPRCTGTAVLWVRRYGQMDDTWATGVWLFIQTKACWWYEGWFPSSGGWWHIYSLKWVYPLHLSSLYTYFRAHSFVLSFQSF